MTDNKVYITRIFQCPIEVLYDYFISPDLIQKWFGPPHTEVSNVNIDPTEGASFQITLFNPNTNNSFSIVGEYIKLQPPEIIEFSYRYSGLDPSPPDSMVQIRFHSLGASTEMNFVQEFEIVPEDMVSRKNAWDSMFQVLSGLLSV